MIKTHRGSREGSLANLGGRGALQDPEHTHKISACFAFSLISFITCSAKAPPSANPKTLRRLSTRTGAGQRSELPGKALNSDMHSQ